MPLERKFIGFDAYQKAMGCLKPGDIATFATPPAFRWVPFAYPIKKGLTVFMEKPVTVDGPTSRRMFELGEESVRRNLKVGVGLMIRHCQGRQELWRRIQDGQIGEILAMRAYRMAGGRGGTAAKIRVASAICSIRSNVSMVFSGPAADVSAIFIFIKSTNVRG